MKKILLGLIAAAGFAASAHAQLADGTVFPDFTLTDINGNVHHLYADLDAGKTVFIDISATWCNPCWQYHESGALDTLYAKHGPAGATGVYPTTTDDVVVLFVQGEPTSHLAELYATAGSTPGSASVETPYATASQGDWTAHTAYPMIDDTTSSDPTVGTAALDNAWNIAFFPTVYMICRDHLVHSLTQPTADDAYAAVAAGCPSTAPASGASVDAKAVPYTGTGYFTCTAAPTLSFQNYSTTTPITAATITVKDGTGATVGTQNWTGNLAPLDVANVTLATPFAGSAFEGYTFTVTVAGDSYAADDSYTGSTFAVYAAANAQTIPYTEDFSNVGSLSDKYQLPEPNGWEFFQYSVPDPSSGADVDIVGPSDNADTVLIFDDYDASNSGASFAANYAIPFIFGNYNTTGLTHETIQFDLAYAAKTSVTHTDSFKVLVSNDCGVTYHSVLTVGGTALESAPAVSSGWFIPSAAAQWKHFSAPIGAYANSNLMVAFESKTPAAGSGELLYLDNITFVNSTAVQQVNLTNNVSIYPNPAKDVAYVSFTLSAETTVQVDITDAMGRVISTLSQHLNAGDDKIELSTAAFAAGIYNVKITNGESVTVQKLTVIK